MKLKLSLFAFLTLNLVAAGTLHADDDIVANGRAVFVAQCSRCHGLEAKGDGVDAKRLWIAPRDLTSGKFKFKSTAYGTPPSDDDISNGIIGHGLAGSGMPSFANLDKDVRASLVAYIKTISPAFANDQKPQPIPNPANMKASADLQKGKEVFTKLQCALCHGENGRANGTSAFTLVDAWNKPIRVANLSQGWTYRGGSEPIDIYHRILAGIEGAPMPSYEGAASHEDIWQLCNYVASLQLKTNWSGQINAAKVNGALPSKADDAQWKKAERTDVNMQNYFYENGRRAHLTVNAVSVKALYNDGSIALLITWDDPIKDEGKPGDTLLIAIKPVDFDGDPRANLHTLYTPNAHPLDLALWQASNPKTTGQKKTNLYSATHWGWQPDQILESSAQYEDGHWTLVVTRPLALEGGETLKAGSDVRYIGFAAWDGHNDESGEKHSASQWIRLMIGTGAAHE